MLVLRLLCVFCVLLVPYSVSCQQLVTGRVFDKTTREPIPFATVKYGSGKQGVIAGLDGVFELPIPNAVDDLSSIEISSMGYSPLRLTLPLSVYNLYLQPVSNTLADVTVKPPYDKMRRLINLVIDNNNLNNPDKYEQYKCHIYYKMVADISLPDSVMKDTAANSRRKADFVTNQHLLLSETYSIRRWRSPQTLQEDILATRLSGLKKAMFTSTITDVLPFHAYNSYIAMNGKDYQNPMSKGYERKYSFNLADEMLDGTDTVWILSFRPKGKNSNLLTGKVYIHSSGYAISRIVATAKDTLLGQTIKIEQQYKQISDDGQLRWFPASLNYIIDRQMEKGSSFSTLHLKGNSQIDSVSWGGEPGVKFDKNHTVRMAPDADNSETHRLAALRPAPLDDKEVRTYRVIDSFGNVAHADEMMHVMRNLPEGRISVGAVDVDLKRILSVNKYENVRLGLGLQTNDKLVKWLSVGGWAGYGFRDKAWKYGAHAEVYADKYKEFVIRAAYTDDIADPGRIRIHPDLDKNYLRTFLLQRVDEAKTLSITVSKKIGYWDAEISALQQEILPRYGYALNVNGQEYNAFNAREATLSVRYAYARRTAPFMGKYYTMGSKYPMWYGKVTAGELTAGATTTSYIQAITAVSWQKHINRLGNERMMVQAGKVWSDAPLPLSKLFVGNGFKYDAASVLSIYAFGGLMTMYPYEYYTDEYVQVCYRHDFNWKLFRVESVKSKISAAPNIGLQYNLLYGTLANRESHRNVAIGVPYKGYHEAGLMLNNLLRLRSGSTYYTTLNLGYFYNPTPVFNLEQNGKFVFGLSVEL